MFAVIRTGGKQYKVSPGDIIKVEKISYQKGDIIDLKDIVLAYSGDFMEIGFPVLKKFYIKAEILDVIRDKKIIVFKKRRRKSSKTKQGHRQNLTVIRVMSIESI